MPVITRRTTQYSCSVCEYPLQAPTEVGQQVKCPYCGALYEAIAQNGVVIPTAVFVGFVCFAGGALLGPALWSATKGGAMALERLARERIR